MALRPQERSPGRVDAFTGGCLLLLVLVADTAAGLLVFIVLAARGLSRMHAGAEPPPADWAPVLGYGTLALPAGATGVVFLRLGNRFTGVVQLALCVVAVGAALSAWP